MSKINDFRALHSGNEPFVLGNVWNAKSAKLAEEAGFKALGISGHAIAENLGYGDGEDMSFEELKFMVKRVIDAVSLPVSVDMDGGYSRDPEEVARNMEELMQLGAAGINIEDSVMHDNKRGLVEPEDFAEVIEEIRAFLIQHNSPFFVNVRIDTYLTKQEQPLDETLKRIKIYEEAGADGIFIPLLIEPDEVQQVIESTRLPLNYYLRPESPSFQDLSALGVKRISYGTAVHARSYAKAEELFNSLIKEQRFQVLFP